jgi:hypothetical protein
VACGVAADAAVAPTGRATGAATMAPATRAAPARVRVRCPARSLRCRRRPPPRRLRIMGVPFFWSLPYSQENRIHHVLSTPRTSFPKSNRRQGVLTRCPGDGTVRRGPSQGVGTRCHRWWQLAVGFGSNLNKIRSSAQPWTATTVDVTCRSGAVYRGKMCPLFVASAHTRSANRNAPPPRPPGVGDGPTSGRREPPSTSQGADLKTAMPAAQYMAVPNDPAKVWVPGAPSTW